MSWLIDDLSNENESLHSKVFELSQKLNCVIRECSGLITENYKKTQEIERLKSIVDRHHFQFGIKEDNTKEIALKINKLYPSFLDKIKLFWSILKCE